MSVMVSGLNKRRAASYLQNEPSVMEKCLNLIENKKKTKINNENSLRREFGTPDNRAVT